MPGNDVQMTVRLPREVAARIEALATSIRRVDSLVSETRSTVARLAIVRGLDVLETELSKAPKGAKRRRR